MPGTDARARLGFLSLLFFASGVAGLVYQICWQRLLFAAFGSDLPSITIIVSAFMAGLGIGALFGGWLADRWPQFALQTFCACEAGIGLFGLASPGLLRTTGDEFVTASVAVVALVNFLLVLVPTVMMGATLPVLVSHVARIWRNVGRATGQLYSVNTLGAALGALLPTFVLFAHVSLDAVIRMAGILNLLVATLTLLVLSRSEARS